MKLLEKLQTFPKFYRWVILGLLIVILFLILWTSTSLFNWVDPGHVYPTTPVYEVDTTLFLIS